MYKMILGAALASLFVLAPAHAGDVQAGERKAQVCQACHGPDGNGIGDPQYPLLAGQHADYMEKTLRDYRSGARDNAIMAGFAGTLSDQDIRDLSAFYASQTGPLRDMRGTR